MYRTCFKLVIFLIISLFSLSVLSQNRDIDLLRHINLDRNRSFDGTFRLITNSASPISFGTPVIMCGIGLIKRDSLLLRKSMVVASSVAATVIITAILKYTINRPRPFETYPDIQKVTGGGSPSFPSGHTSEAFSLATSVSLAYPKWYIIVPSFVWAGAVGYSRMDLGVHYPSDVLAGAILGAGCSWITFKVNQKLNQRKQKFQGARLNLSYLNIYE
jgi:membrane-associated phospholipid phosphatase